MGGEIRHLDTGIYIYIIYISSYFPRGGSQLIKAAIRNKDTLGVSKSYKQSRDSIIL